MSSKDVKANAIKAAMSVAEDVSSGRVAPADLEAQALAECRQLFGRVVGPGDPLWELHVDICRQVLAVDSAGGGIPAEELAQWATVEQRAEDERALVGVVVPADESPGPDSSASVLVGAVSEAPQPEPDER